MVPLGPGQFHIESLQQAPFVIKTSEPVSNGHLLCFFKKPRIFKGDGQVFGNAVEQADMIGFKLVGFVFKCTD